MVKINQEVFPLEVWVYNTNSGWVNSQADMWNTRGQAKMGNSKVCLKSRIKVNDNVITKKTQFFSSHNLSSLLYQTEGQGGRHGEFSFFIFVLFILILVALYQVGSRLRSRHVEFISEFYRWLAAEKSLVGGQ